MSEESEGQYWVGMTPDGTGATYDENVSRVRVRDSEVQRERERASSLPEPTLKRCQKQVRPHVGTGIWNGQ